MNGLNEDGLASCVDLKVLKGVSWLSDIFYSSGYVMSGFVSQMGVSTDLSDSEGESNMSHFSNFAFNFF